MYREREREIHITITYIILLAILLLLLIITIIIIIMTISLSLYIYIYISRRRRQMLGGTTCQMLHCGTWARYNTTETQYMDVRYKAGVQYMTDHFFGCISRNMAYKTRQRTPSEAGALRSGQSALYGALCVSADVGIRRSYLHVCTLSKSSLI